MTEPSQYFKGRTVQEQMDEVIGYVDVRSAEVATTAIASDVAQVHQDMLDANADASAAAASAAAAAGTLANAVKKTGEASQSIAGDIAISGALSVSGAVTVPAPIGNTNATTKKYVDDQDALNVKLAGNQTIADVKTFSSSPVVPTVATGTADTKAANGTKVKNELDNYAPMLRTTGNQNITGIKTFGNNQGITCKVGNFGTGISMNQTADDYTQPTDTEINYPYIDFRDTNNAQVAILRFNHTNNLKKLEMLIKDNNGTFHTTVLATWTDS